MCHNFAYPGLNMDWSASEWLAPFLDMHIFVNWASLSIEHERGTFLWEMSQLATLSSRPEIYEDALHHLKTLYVARGYPEPLLNSWLRENNEKRWLARLQEQVRQGGNIFVLKSQFNPVIDSFNVHELFDVICKEWIRSCESLPWCDVEGFCAIHNAKRILKPADVHASKKARTATLYKYRLEMAEHLVPLNRSGPSLSWSKQIFWSSSTRGS